ncbi:MAG: TrmH family RNA methyltransferase [Bacteroidia bacterium]|nr:TrmH family RNA methyltransferase [Bacteroidia bacterium]
MRKLQNEELQRPSLKEYKSTTKMPLVVVLDNIRSQNNTGSVFRTSDAFLVEKLCLCGFTGTPPHREIQKTALGATDSVVWEYYSDTAACLTKLRNEGYTLYAIEQADESIDLKDFNVQRDDKIAIIFGNEVNGVASEVVQQCDGCIELAQYGTKHSLNIAVCAGIVIYDLFHKMTPYRQ